MKMFIIVSAFAALTWPGAPPFAQSYPVKTVRYVVAFAAGDSPDIVARLVADRMSRMWDQQMVVENRVGAGGTIAGAAVANAAPDGYTLFHCNIASSAIASAIYPKLPYDPIRDFAPVALFAMVPNMLVVHPSLPANSVKELVALARARPGQLNYGSSGNGSASHLATEYFKLLSKTDITAIPYKGTGPLVTDLIAGQTSLTITGVPPLYPHVQSGRLRALAVGSVKRLPLLPSLPTIAEAGVPGYESSTWFGPLAPAKTPREIIVRLNVELMKMLQRPDVRARFAAEGIEALGSTPEEFGTYIKSEIERWSRVIKAAHVRPE